MKLKRTQTNCEWKVMMYINRGHGTEPLEHQNEQQTAVHNCEDAGFLSYMNGFTEGQKMERERDLEVKNKAEEEK